VADTPLRWTADIENTTGRTLFISTQIQSLEAEPDGSALHVSTMRPLLSDDVYVPFFRLETEQLSAGDRLETEFTIELPLRLHRMAGVPLRAEVTEWVPADQLEIHMTLAFGERPFYPPGDRAALGRTLEEWGEAVALPPLRVARETATGGDQHGVDQ
jgi:hypothetical protein